MKRFSLLLNIIALVVFFTFTGCSVAKDADIEANWSLESVDGVDWKAWGMVYTFKGGEAYYTQSSLGSSFISKKGKYTVTLGTLELSEVPGLVNNKYNAEIKDGVLYLRDPNSFDTSKSAYSFKKQ
ncbi:MAG TPA: hypothetical protein PK771_08305 [Spirochaetota bacterium]|nr:hypothetical protein [Spirochaetota bacterium]